MTTREFLYTVQPATPTQPSVLAAIAADLAAYSPSAPCWSIELPTEMAASRYLAATHPTRPSGATRINDNIGCNGEATGPNKAFKGWNDASFAILSGAGGPYASHWDSTKGEWWLSYGTTGWFPWSQTVVRYQMARDEFRHWQASAQGAADGLWDPYGNAHNFGMSTIDPVGRRLYRTLRPQQYNSLTSSPQQTTLQADGLWADNGTYKLLWLDLDDPTIRGTDIQGWNIGHGTHMPIEFCPLMGGPAGSVVCFRFNPGNIQPWFRYDVGSGTYQFDLPSVRVNRTPAKVLCNGSIYGTEDYTSDATHPYGKFWRLDADKSYHDDLRGPPVWMNGSGNSPKPADYRHTELAAIGTKIYAFRPGDLLTNVPQGEGYVYCYDTIADTWTEVDRMAQNQIPIPTTYGATGEAIAFSVTAVPELGVVVCAQARDLGDYVNTDCAFVWRPPAETEADSIASALVAGQWSSELTTPRYLANGTINSLIGYDGTDGTLPPASGFTKYRAHAAPPTSSNTNLLDWAGKGHYDPVNREVWYCGGTTGSGPHSLTMIRYSLRDNTFRHWQGSAIGSPGLFTYGAPHNFEGSCFDPVGRKIYRLLKDPVNGPHYLGAWNVDTKAATLLATGSTNPNYYHTLEFHPGIGTQGSVLLFTGSANSTGNEDDWKQPIQIFDVAAGAWNDASNPTILAANSRFIGDPGAAVCYHAGTGQLFFTNPGTFTGTTYHLNQALYSINASKVITTKAIPPVPMGKGYQSASGKLDATRLVVLGDYIYAFTSYGGGRVHRYDIVNDQWNSGWTPDTIPWTHPLGAMLNAYAAPLPDLNVIMIVREIDNFSNEALLWKAS